MKAHGTIGMLALLGLLWASAAASLDAGEIQSMLDDGQAKDAVRQVEAYVEANEQDPEGFYWLATAQLAQIDDASTFRKPFLARAARKNLETALTLKPDHLGANESLARYLLEAPAIVGGSIDGAREQATRLLALDEASGSRVMASIAEKDDQYDQAVSWLRRALSAETWTWEKQYQLVVSAVHWQVEEADAVLEEAREEVGASGELRQARLLLIDYQLGKLAATTSRQLEAGRAALERYLQHTPDDEAPGLDWAAFRLAQIERELGLDEAADRRLAQLESSVVDEGLSFALRDERRWHYED